MIRDEHRKECIEAMTVAYLSEIRKPRLPAELMTMVFDALHGIARVNPIEATAEMMLAVTIYNTKDIVGRWRAMSAAGDLTNPPEGKP